MTGGGLSSSGSQYIGFSGVGTFLQQGGGNSIYRGYTDGSSCLYLGYNVGSCGTYTLSGTAGLALESTTSSAIEYVGYSGSGTFIQTGGTNSVVSLDNFDGCYGYIYIGYNSGATGTYSLSSGSCSSDIQYVGYSGTGSFSQSGGTNTIYNLYLGYNTTSQGTYELSGSGTFNFLNRYVGYSGTGKFTQSGGTISGQPNEGDLYVGYNAGSCGTYELTGTGVIGPNYNYYEYVGYSGAGTFTHSGGSNTLASSGCLYLGYSTTGTGVYQLSGAGVLTSFAEYVGNSGTGTLIQSGGINTATDIEIGTRGSYALGGGTLSLSGGLVNNGAIDLSNSSARINASSAIIDLSRAIFANSHNVSLSLDSHSLLIVPSGIDPATYFTSYSNFGLVEQVGSTFTIPSGYAITGIGNIPDHLNCQGTITATSFSYINLDGGVSVAGSGGAILGTGSIYVNDATSGMSGISITAGSLYAGYSGSGTFTHSAGYIGLSSLYLGYNAADAGTYQLAASLNSTSEYVGFSGTGAFAHNSGGNSISQSLYLGYNFGASGGYTLSAGSLTCTYAETIGYSGWGTFIQASGTNTASSAYLGYNVGGSGAYALSGIGFLSLTGLHVGYNGAGTFTQTAGTSTLSQTLMVGETSTGQGIYLLGGSARLIANAAYVGNSGSGIFVQSGGTTSLTYGLYLGYSSTSNGVYTMSGASALSAANEYVGYSGSGTITQSGGTNAISTNLYLGYKAAGSGTYLLNGTGALSAGWEFLGGSGSGTLTQSGGANTAMLVQISPGGCYSLGAGMLNLKGGGLVNNGVLDLSNSTATIDVSSSIVDLSGAILCNSAGMSVALDSHSLLIVPTGLDPRTDFRQFSGDGIVHQVGSSLPIPSAYSICGVGTITDRVDCQGTLTATSGYSINLGSGLSVADGGSVNLGGGSLTVNDATSGIDHAWLTVAGQSVGLGGAGTFTQSAGVNAISGYLYLGCNSGDSGTYVLGGGSLSSSSSEYVGYTGAGTFIQSGGSNTVSGTIYLASNTNSSGSYILGGGSLSSSSSEYVGYTGAGTFIQSGGSNTVSGTLYLAYNTKSSGSFQLSGDSNLLVSSDECVGYSGTATFTQSGGTNSISGGLALGLYSTASGNYNLNGGVLVLSSLSRGSGTATFSFGGGTLRAGAAFTCSLPIALTANGGDAAIDTAGYAVTLSGALTGPGGLNKLGTNILTLSAANTYSGTTTVAAGGLQAAMPASLPGYGVSGSISVNTDATLIVNYGGASDWKAADVDALRADVSFAPGSLLGFDTSHASSGGSYTSPITGDIGIAKYGTNILTLGSANTYTGKTIANGGELSVSSASCLGTNPADFIADQLSLNGGTLLASASFTLDDNRGITLGTGGGTLSSTSGTILMVRNVIAGSGNLTVAGSGSVVLGVANTYTGATTCSAGTLTVQNQNAIQNSTFAGGAGVLVFDSVVPNHIFTFGGLSGSSALSLQDNANNAITLLAGNNGASTSFSGILNGSGSLVKIGAGTLTLAGANTYTGKTIVDNGALAINSDASLGANPANFTADQLTLDGGALLATASFTLGSNRGITLGESGGALAANSGANLTIATVISGGSLTKTAGGTLTLSGANTYTGRTIVGGGTLVISNDANLGTNPSSFTADQLTLDGGTLLASGSFTFGNNRGITLGTNGGTLSCGGTSPFTVANAITGSGNLTVAGSGSVVLSTANTYSGATVVSSGTLTLQHQNAIQNSTFGGGAGTLAFPNTRGGHVFTFGGLSGSTPLAIQDIVGHAVALSIGNNNAGTVYSGVLSGSGSLTKIGTGTLTLSGANTYAGPTTIVTGALEVSNTAGSATGRGAVTVDSGATLTGSGIIGGPVSVTGTLRRATVQGESSPSTTKSRCNPTPRSAPRYSA